MTEDIKLDADQAAAVYTDASRVVIIAGPACGKTRITVERIKFILEKGADSSKVVVITFTNNAAATIRERLGELASNCFIGTVHGYCNQLLKRKGYSTKSLIDRKDFDGLFQEIKKHPDAIPEIDFLFLDEAQDSTDLQFEFMFKTLKPKNFFVVGDFRQCIYSYAGSNPNLLLELAKEPDVVTFQLQNNYRNSILIDEFASSILEELPSEFRNQSNPLRQVNGKVMKISGDYVDLANLINTFKDYKNWAILCRTNAIVNGVCKILRMKGIPVDSFRQAQFDQEQIEEKLKADTVKVLTCHSSKGLEFNKVVVIGTNTKAPEETRLSYVAATRARNLLIWFKVKRRK